MSTANENNEMFSEIQTIVEQEEEQQPTTYTPEALTEIQRSLDNPTIQFTDNFPTSVTEVMMFKFEDNGVIAAKKLTKKMLHQHSVKKPCFGHLGH